MRFSSLSRAVVLAASCIACLPAMATDPAAYARLQRLGLLDAPAPAPAPADSVVTPVTEVAAPRSEAYAVLERLGLLAAEPVRVALAAPVDAVAPPVAPPIAEPVAETDAPSAP